MTKLKSMVRLNAVRHLIDPVGQKGNNQPFNISFCKKSSGEIVSGKCICLSAHNRKDLATIRFIASGETRTIHISLITRFNGEKVY